MRVKLQIKRGNNHVRGGAQLGMRSGPQWKEEFGLEIARDQRFRNSTVFYLEVLSIEHIVGIEETNPQMVRNMSRQCYVVDKQDTHALRRREHLAHHFRRLNVPAAGQVRKAPVTRGPDFLGKMPFANLSDIAGCSYYQTKKTSRGIFYCKFLKFSQLAVCQINIFRFPKI